MTAYWYDLLTLLAIFIYIIWRIHIERLDDELDKQRDRDRRNLGRNM